MEKVTIKFANGSEVEAEVNGNCYITNAVVQIPTDLSVITIEDGEETTVLKNMKFVECASVDGRFWFAFVPMSEIEIELAEIEDALCELSTQ